MYSHICICVFKIINVIYHVNKIKEKKYFNFNRCRKKYPIISICQSFIETLSTLGIKVTYLDLIKITQQKPIANIIFTGDILIPLKNMSKTRMPTVPLLLNLVVET